MGKRKAESDPSVSAQVELSDIKVSWLEGPGNSVPITTLSGPTVQVD